jgi:hypothetical protein
VVELAYTPALGAGARKSMRVRVPPPALIDQQLFTLVNFRFRAHLLPVLGLPFRMGPER